MTVEYKLVTFCHISAKPDFTIMFAGITGAGKSSAGNFILNKRVFTRKRGLIHCTDKCSAVTLNVCDKTVKIIDTPGFFDAFTPTEQNFMEVSRALTFAKDGINAVAFVMKYERFTEQTENAFQQILKLEGVHPFMFVLFTHAEDDGVTKAATDELIQQDLSDSQCPSGFKKLMQLVNNRVIMLESVGTTPESYQLQKREEFITMIDVIHKSNGCKTYSNVILQHVAQAYENNRLLQQIFKRKAVESSESNKEKIKQLKKPDKDTTSNESSKVTKVVNDEIVSLMQENKKLEEACKEFEDKQCLTRITCEDIADNMKNSNIKKFTILEFFDEYTSSERLLVMGLYFGIKFGMVAGQCIGTTIGHVIHRSDYRQHSNCRQQ